MEYNTLHEALNKNKRDGNIIPTWIPDGYELTDIRIEHNPMQEAYLAIYHNGNRVLKISVQTYLSYSPEQVEKSDELVEIYSCNGIDYYIFSNHNQNRIVWISDLYECYISGELSIEDMKHMIDSVSKG